MVYFRFLALVPLLANLMSLFFEDCHCHSNHSLDGHHSMETIFLAAVNAGMSAVAITDHCDMNMPFDLPAHRSDFEQARIAVGDRIEVSWGIELGDWYLNPERAQATSQEGFDFIIGSIHAFPGKGTIASLTYDRAKETLPIFGGYIETLTEMASHDFFDVIGHMTYPLRYTRRNPELLGATFAPFEDQLRVLFKTLIENGKGIELNVSWLFRDPPLLMPNLSVLKLYKECGGEIITLGSDAHKAEHVGKGILAGVEFLLEAGFSYVSVFQERRPHFEAL
jgi:histidinol-phosphatase (PHP family)